jgi:Zn-dependent M32 family carboxypeptidase
MDPNDIEDIRKDLEEFRSAKSPAEHPDYGEDIALIRPLAEAVQELNRRLAETHEMVDKMYDHYFNQFIGGLTKLYDDNSREDGMESLRGKYGADFEPFGGYLKQLLGNDGDVFPHIYDHLKSHWDDEGFDGDDFVDQILDELEDKIDSMRKALGSGSEKDEEPAEPEGPDAGMIVEKISKFPQNIDLDEITKSARRGIKAG